MRQMGFLLSLLLLLTVCGTSPSTRPAAGENGGAETQHPAPATPTAPPVQAPEATPEPLPEGSPLTLAGEALASAVMMEEGGYSFSTGAAANLEGWFRLMGFQEEGSFYQYDDGEGLCQLRLWYDEERQVGVGLRYGDQDGEVYGFGFRSVTQAQRDPEGDANGFGWYRWEDAAALPARPDFVEEKDYREEGEEDAQGRLVRFQSWGEFPDSGFPRDQWWVYSLEYCYDETGNLTQRTFGRNSILFSTTNPGQKGFFDSRGRLAYEWGYITHGSTDTYYIYEGEGEAPAYALYLDYSHGSYFPEFARY